ncbi:MAG: DNA adenine methylase [Stenotrophomonas sp.]|uniref:DNA adenine methylase n=1 Tax=Gammaproteobacteria TaxID=1236 RepID=UPI003D6CE9D9
MAFVTPLRYPGGKGRLGHWLGEVISHNDLRDGCYVEPYAGGAGAAAFLLKEKLVERIHINDLDPLIFAFWRAVFNQTKSLASMVLCAEVTLAARERAKETVRNAACASQIELAFATFMLNRTSRSGILSGGPIGGRKQDGKYKVDARFNAEGLASRIEALGALRKRVTVTNCDASDLLGSISKVKGNFVYCDPPYYEKGHQLYKSHYSSADHAGVASLMLDMKCPWLVTYDDRPEISELYVGASCLRFGLHYSTHLMRPKAQELMFYGNLNLPRAPYLHR